MLVRKLPTNHLKLFASLDHRFEVMPGPSDLSGVTPEFFQVDTLLFDPVLCRVDQAIDL